MKTYFEKRIARINAKRPTDADKQILEDVGAAMGNHILGFRGPLWLRIMLRTASVLAAPALVMAAATLMYEDTFATQTPPSEYVETGVTFGQRAFNPEVIKAQFELGLIGLKLSTGTLSDEDAARYSANNSAEMRRLERIATLGN